jgi:PAS domain-containing protein
MVDNSKLAQKPQDAKGNPEQQADRKLEEILFEIENLERQLEVLRQSHALLESLQQEQMASFYTAPVASLLLNPQGLIQDANEASASLLGDKRSAFLGREFSRFVPRKFRDIYHQHWQTLQQLRARQRYVIVLQGKESAFSALLNFAFSYGDTSEVFLTIHRL